MRYAIQKLQVDDHWLYRWQGQWFVISKEFMAELRTRPEFREGHYVARYATYITRAEALQLRAKGIMMEGEAQ